jgi:hypothetical protein
MQYIERQRNVVIGWKRPQPCRQRQNELYVSLWPILLQNSFLGCVQNFPEALVRSLKNYVGGHMIDPISNRHPS